MTPEEILSEVKANFDRGARRKFLPGLLIAMIDLILDLGAERGRFRNLEDFYRTFPLETTTKQGSGANTLIVRKDARTTVSLRPFYNRAETWFRADNRRFDYPSAAPHATQAWKDYAHWLEALLQLNRQEMESLKLDVQRFVLEKLPEHGVSPETLKREPPRFYLFLRDFDVSKKIGETTGAAYQGTVFGYIRADSSHLQVDVAKVRTGSKRVGRVGDIDARDGEALVLSAEVKQYTVGDDTLPSLAEFAALVHQHCALGLIAALDFEDGIREKISAMGLEAVSRQDLVERVRLWDPLKQRIATQALLYYVQYKEQNSALLQRLKTFFASIEPELGSNA